MCITNSWAYFCYCWQSAIYFPYNKAQCINWTTTPRCIFTLLLIHCLQLYNKEPSRVSALSLSLSLEYNKFPHNFTFILVEVSWCQHEIQCMLLLSKSCYMLILIFKHKHKIVVIKTKCAKVSSNYETTMQPCSTQEPIEHNAESECKHFCAISISM